MNPPQVTAFTRSSGGQPPPYHRICLRPPTGAYSGSLNVVASHARGFFVGGSRGEILVFEQDDKTVGGDRDVYTLTRAVRIFGVELVELTPTMGPDYEWVSRGTVWVGC